MGYPKTGNEVYVSFSLSNTMFSGIGKGTITRELVSVDYLKDLFQKYGVIVSAKPEQRRLLELVNEAYGLGLEIPDTLKLARLSEKNRRLVLISVQGLKRVNGSLLPSYSEEEFQEATFEFVKYYVQSRHYDDLVAENNKLKSDLESEIAWRTRTTADEKTEQEPPAGRPAGGSPFQPWSTRCIWAIRSTTLLEYPHSLSYQAISLTKRSSSMMPAVSSRMEVWGSPMISEDTI